MAIPAGVAKVEQGRPAGLRVVRGEAEVLLNALDYRAAARVDAEVLHAALEVRHIVLHFRDLQGRKPETCI
jgi:hypothetical protein